MHPIKRFSSAIILTAAPLGLGYLLPTFKTLYSVFAAVSVMLLFAFSIIGTELATWIVMFLLYVNVGGIATQVYQVPSLVAGSFLLLLALPITDYLLVRKESPIVDTVLKLMLVFLVIVLVSSWLAQDSEIAFAWTIEYLQEGLLLYFLVINVVRSFDVMKRVIWVLLLACALLASLTVYQELTLDYRNELGGFAQRTVREDWSGVDKRLEKAKVGTSYRAQGPVGDPNRYAQNLLMVLPLGFFIFWQERCSRKEKIASACAIIFIFSAVLLTYSRGAFVAILLTVGVLTLLRYISVYRLVFALAATLTLGVVAPGYLLRIQTIGGVEGLVSEESGIETDRVIRGRLTEMLAALNVYLDHPILGVGPANYVRFYSQDYMSDPDVAFRDINRPRRAHNLYVELAAETGTLGAFVFVSIVVVAMRRLLQLRRRWLDLYPEHARLATAFVITIVSYLGTAVFLQLSFQRYFWLMLALSGAACHLLTLEGPYRAGGVRPESQ